MTGLRGILRPVVLIAIGGSLTTVSARAQGRVPATLSSASGQLVRVRLHTGTDVRGTLHALDSDNDRLVLGSPARTIGLEQVETLAIRHHRARAGAKVGSLAAGISMFAFTTSLCFTGSGCLTSGPGDTTGARWRAVGLSTVVAASAGALAGGAIGRFLHRWDLVDLR